MENGELLREARKMYFEISNSTVEEFKNELKKRPYLRAENLYDMINNKMDKMFVGDFEGVRDLEEYKGFAMQLFLKQSRELNIQFSKERFMELMEDSPEIIRGIDLVDRGASKILVDLIKEDSKYIKYVTDDLTADKLLKIGRQYKREQEYVKEKYSDEEDKKNISEDDKFYYDGDSDFILQLIKTNPDILQESTMKYVSQRDPDIKLSCLFYEKGKLEQEYSNINKEIDKLQEMARYKKDCR